MTKKSKTKIALYLISKFLKGAFADNYDDGYVPLPRDRDEREHIYRGIYYMRQRAHG